MTQAIVEFTVDLQHDTISTIAQKLISNGYCYQTQQLTFQFKNQEIQTSQNHLTNIPLNLLLASMQVSQKHTQITALTQVLEEQFLTIECVVGEGSSSQHEMDPMRTDSDMSDLNGAHPLDIALNHISQNSKMAQIYNTYNEQLQMRRNGLGRRPLPNNLQHQQNTDMTNQIDQQNKEPLSNQQNTMDNNNQQQITLSSQEQQKHEQLIEALKMYSIVDIKHEQEQFKKLNKARSARNNMVSFDIIRANLQGTIEVPFDLHNRRYLIIREFVAEFEQISKEIHLNKNIVIKYDRSSCMIQMSDFGQLMNIKFVVEAQFTSFMQLIHNNYEQLNITVKAGKIIEKTVEEEQSEFLSLRNESSILDFSAMDNSNYYDDVSILMTQVWITQRVPIRLIINLEGLIVLQRKNKNWEQVFDLIDISQIQHCASKNSYKIIFNFFDNEINPISVYFSKQHEALSFLDKVKSIDSVVNKSIIRKKMFIVRLQTEQQKQSQTDNQKFSWLDNANKDVDFQLSQQFVAELFSSREEDMDYCSSDVTGDDRVIFKVILQINGVNLKKFILMQNKQFCFQILNIQLKIEEVYQLSDVAFLHQDIFDTRRVNIHMSQTVKRNLFTVIFSSVYKSYQFLQLYQSLKEMVEDQKLELRLSTNIDMIDQALDQQTGLTPRERSSAINRPSMDITQIQETNTHQEIRLFAVTWNMAREKQQINYERFIPNPQFYDLIVIGFQEAKMSCKTDYVVQLNQYLAAYQFDMIATKHMWEMVLIGFIKTKHRPFLYHISMKSKAEGIGKVIGNKGGLQMNFALYQKTYNFITCHLKHGAKRVSERNQMMSNLIKAMRINNSQFDADMCADYCFILGDLNYRFQSTYEEMKDQVHKFPSLLESYDQLTLEKKNSGCFPDYEEGVIDFLPGYKRHKLRDNEFVNKKNQCMSYTDRVLFKNNTCQKVKVVKYNILYDIYGSDHRPSFLDIRLPNTQVRYMHDLNILDKQMAQKQNLGLLKFDHIKIKLNTDLQQYQKNAKEPQIKVDISKNIGLHLEFIGFYLDHYAKSSDLDVGPVLQNDIWYTWQRKDLPCLFTPINSLEIIRDKRLFCSIWNNQQNVIIGQINLKLNMLKKVNRKDSRPVLYKDFSDHKIILANQIVGYVSGRIKFQIVTEQEIARDWKKRTQERMMQHMNQRQTQKQKQEPLSSVHLQPLLTQRQNAINTNNLVDNQNNSIQEGPFQQATDFKIQNQHEQSDCNEEEHKNDRCLINDQNNYIENKRDSVVKYIKRPSYNQQFLKLDLGKLKKQSIMKIPTNNHFQEIDSSESSFISFCDEESKQDGVSSSAYSRNQKTLDKNQASNTKQSHNDTNTIQSDDSLEFQRVDYFSHESNHSTHHHNDDDDDDDDPFELIGDDQNEIIHRVENTTNYSKGNSLRKKSKIYTHQIIENDIDVFNNQQTTNQSRLSASHNSTYINRLFNPLTKTNRSSMALQTNKHVE